MKIALYPEFNDVFVDNTLKGIFYPLCSVYFEDADNNKIHFISSNGLWFDENLNDELNSEEYCIFDYEDDKYSFNGNINVYKGQEYAKNIYTILEKDFEINGEKFLSEKTSTEDYIKQVISKVPKSEINDFDSEYFIGTFYEYSIVKLNYLLSSKFSTFRNLIENWHNRETPFVYSILTGEMQGTLNHLDKPKIKNIENYELIGKTIASEFFTDGNDSLIYFNVQERKVLLINSYS